MGCEHCDIATLEISTMCALCWEKTQMSVLETKGVTSVATGLMWAVVTAPMSAAETSQMSDVLDRADL